MCGTWAWRRGCGSLMAPSPRRLSTPFCSRLLVTPLSKRGYSMTRAHAIASLYVTVDAIVSLHVMIQTTAFHTPCFSRLPVTLLRDTPSYPIATIAAAAAAAYLLRYEVSTHHSLSLVVVDAIASLHLIVRVIASFQATVCSMTHTEKLVGTET